MVTRLRDGGMAIVAAAAAGAGAGYWLFALRGALLFATVGAAAALGLRMSSRFAPRVSPAVALLLAAWAFHSASALGWGGADAPDGTRYKVSPVGLSHVLEPERAVSPTTDCAWYGRSESTRGCPVAAEAGVAVAGLRAVYPLVLAAAVLCVVAGILSVSRVGGGRRRVRVGADGAVRLAAAGALLASLAAVVAFVVFARAALAPLADLSFGVGGTLGMMLMVTAMLVCFVIAASPVTTPSSRTGRRERDTAGPERTAAALPGGPEPTRRAWRSGRNLAG